MLDVQLIISEQAINQTNDKPDLKRHMVSPEYKSYIYIMIYMG